MPILPALIAAAVIGVPDGGELVLPNHDAVSVRVPGLVAYSSSSDAVTVQLTGDTLQLSSDADTGTQLDLFLDGGAHSELRVFSRRDSLTERLPIDHLPLTHSPQVKVRLVSDKIVAVRGPLGSVEDAVALEILAEAHSQLVPLVSLGASKLSEAMAAVNAGMPSGLRAVWAGDRVVLRGRASPELLRAAEQRADLALGFVGNAIKAGRMWIRDDAHESAPLLLAVGSQKVLTVPGLTRVAVANPEVADTKVLGAQQVLIIGMTEGETALELLREPKPPLRYAVSVVKEDPDEIVCDACFLLPQSRVHAHITFVGDKLMIRGDIEDVPRALGVADILRLSPNVTLFDHPSDARLATQASVVSERLREAGVSSVKVVRTGSKLWFEGTPADPSDLAIAQGLEEAWFEPFARLARDAPAPLK